MTRLAPLVAPEDESNELSRHRNSNVTSTPFPLRPRFRTPLGGEEFAIILPGADSAAARKFAERLRDLVAKTPCMQDGKTLAVTVSIGIATSDAHDSNAGDALIRADGALYRAKRNGRNRVEQDATVLGTIS
jgi:predicted signal transduction protein with EAL and GGDEF domain